MSEGRPRRRRILRIALICLAILLALPVVVAGAGYIWLRQSLPQVDGTIRLDGLSAPVTVVRDRWAVPHIEAESFLDATFALGFVHAQDRFWQMEFQRRVGAGRLAKIIGEPVTGIDRFMRTLGLYRLAEASLEHVDATTLAWLDAYAAGVNAWLETRSGPLPPEFVFLRHGDIEPWRPADSVVYIKMMALNLSTNWRQEILRARLARRLSNAQIEEFWPAYPEAAPVTLTALARTLPADALAAALPPATAAASNAWVVDGSRTTTGAPLLANDPHLGLRAPGTWYLAHLSSPEVELAGATLPGVPGIILGHNGHVAWGFTTTGSDTQDLFVERSAEDDPTRYLTPDGTAPFEVREEVIGVAGGDDVVLEVRATRHGPVVSDLLPGEAEAFGADRVLALAWPALREDDRTIQALLRLLHARDAATFVEAMRDVTAPQQNVLFTDTAGRIGMYVPGLVPIRRNGDGRWPVPGWSGEYDWIGWIPFEDLPHAVDPPGGALFNANNKVVPDGYPYFITADWDASYRARRIAELLPGEAHDLQSFAAMQADVLSPLARDVLPLMLEAAPADDAAATITAALREWDHVMRPDAFEPLVFSAWFRELSRLVYADELGDAFDGARRIRPEFMLSVLEGRTAWCDDIATAALETCPQLINRALGLAISMLEAQHGDDVQEWRWGEAHVARMAHPVFEHVPVLARLFNILVPTGGDGTTIDVGHYRVYAAQQPFASVHAATYRGLFDLADLDRSRFVAATGQSGNPLSSHYRNLSRLWARNETIPMMRDTAAYGDGASGRLVLAPTGID